MSVSKLSLPKGALSWTKGALVVTLLGHFLQTCFSLHSRTAAELIEEYSDIELPDGCECNALSLLSMHFKTRYGCDVASAFRNPPDPIYAFSDDVMCNYVSCVEWAALPQDNLVNWLHKLSMETLSESIHRLIHEGHPSVIGWSRRRKCIGLIQHLLQRLQYLVYAGADTVCDIYLTYSPTSISMAEPDSYYIVKILEH